MLVIGASGGVGTLRRADRQGVRRRGHRREQHGEGGPGPLARRRRTWSTTRATDITDGGERYDVVLDIGGDRRLRRLRQALTPHGTLVIVGGEGGGRWLGHRPPARAALLSPFVGQRLGFFVARENAADLVVLAELVEAGQVTPAVDRTYPLAEAPAAVDYMAGGQARGKVVVEVSR